MLNTAQLSNFIEDKWNNHIIPSLSDYIKIPNKSPHFDSNWQQHGYMEQAVQHIASWCQTNAPKGMILEIVRLPNRTPLIFMEIPGERNETILMYGHLDKQPEMEGWSEGMSPWQPVLKNGCLYGRGAADDGYAAYAATTAICALQAQNISHSRCVILIEACEESGSNDLPFYIDMLQSRIGTPKLVIGLDSGAGNYEQFWMTTSLRGNIVGELSVELISEGVHSGHASGIAADSFRVAKQLISRLEDEKTGEILLPELKCTIPPTRIKEAEACATILGEMIYKELPFYPGVQPVTTNLTDLILNRTWRAALSVIGADGIPAIEHGGNVLRPKTALKLSMRLPPTICAEEAVAAIEKALTENVPYNAKVAFRHISASLGWHAPEMAPWLANAVNEASLHFYKKPAGYLGEGGTIPFMGMLGEKFPHAQFVITGVLGPHSNAHGPNEFLHIDMAKKLTCCISYIISL